MKPSNDKVNPGLAKSAGVSTPHTRGCPHCKGDAGGHSQTGAGGGGNIHKVVQVSRPKNPGLK